MESRIWWCVWTLAREITISCGSPPRCAAWPAAKSVAMPLDVLTELVARGVPASNALQQITQLMRRGATPTHIAGLGASVQSDVAAGLTPDAALEVRARGVMSLLPSPAAAAALAPRGGRP